MKRITVFLTLSLSASAWAQAPIASPSDNFRSSMAAARIYEKSNPGIAVTHYKKALTSATNDDEKAQAQLGIGRSTPLRPKGEADPQGNNASRRAAFQEVLVLPGAAAVYKHEARLELASMQRRLEEGDKGLAQFLMVADSADASDDLRAQAQLAAGDLLITAQRFDEARTRLSTVADGTKSSALQKTAARRTTARAYLAEGKTTQAQMEIDKLAVQIVPDDGQLAQIFMDSGDFFRREKQPAIARTYFEKVPALPGASAGMNIQAVLRLGAAYFDEKNYAQARQMWSNVPTMRSALPSQISEAWKFIATAHLEEKAFPAAREALAKWRESTADVPTKVLAIENIASTFVQEKNFAAAREALTEVGKIGATRFSASDKLQLTLRQKLGTAQVYRQEGDFAQAATLLTEMLEAVPVAAGNPSFYFEYRQTVETAAAELAKEPASRQAAFSLYEAIEKHYPYEFNKGKANMAMGDILVAQGKKDEAKAKYQKVIELRKNYDDAKEAQKKIDALN